MPTVHCRHRSRLGDDKQCGRVLIQLPRAVIKALKASPGEDIIVRCPQCPAYLRWIRIGCHEGKGLTFRGSDRPELDDELKFDTIEAEEYVA